MDHAHLGSLPDGGDHDEVHDHGDDGQEHVHNDHQAASLVRRPVTDGDINNQIHPSESSEIPVNPEIAGGQIGDVLHRLCDVELEEEPVTHDDGADMGPVRLRHIQRLRERRRTEPGVNQAASMLPLLGCARGL